MLLPGLFKVRRRRSLVFSLSLPRLVLSLRQLILSSLTLSRSPSFPSTTISETKTPPFICRLQKKKKGEMLRAKKRASENKTLSGTDLTTSRDSFHLLKGSCYEARAQSREPRLTGNANAYQAGSESRLLLPFSHSTTSSSSSSAFTLLSFSF